MSSASTKPSRRSSITALVGQSRLAQLGLFLVSFAVATLIAKAFGAGWGTAGTFGQIAFVAAVFAILMTDERSAR